VAQPCITEEDIQAVAQVLRSGWITTGPKTSEFEADFRQYTGCNHAVALCSATAGMHLLLHALDIGPGDEVITPSMTWVSTVNLIVIRGATPVFVDVDRDTLMTDAMRIESRLSERTRLILPVHFAGAALDLAPIRDLAARHRLNLVEDAAHAMGTRYQGEAIGARGTAIFSFHPIKNITTGEGGMFCSNDEALIQRIRRLKFHGLGVDAYDRDAQGRAPQAEVLEPGFKYNLPDIGAALGIAQLARLDDMNRRRAALANLYTELLTEIDELLPLAQPDYPMVHAWHLYVVRLDSDRAGISRDAFMQALKQENIATGLHFRAVHTQRYYRETMDIAPDALVNTEWNSKRLCSLPLFPDMHEDDVKRVVGVIKDVLARHKS
jgi:UDP-4-amino-4-deoxy-L-arabinose-oxoglutarate aminotransferase